MKIHRLLTSCALAVAAIASASAAHGATTFNLVYSGAFYGNSASGTGIITVDETQVPKLFGHAPIAIGTVVSDLSLTISGASSGNGAFTLADFATIVFWAPSALDLTQELIGQPLSGGGTFGDPNFDGSAGDFNLFPAHAGAPRGVSFFRLATSNGNGDSLRLISISPNAVPEPASWAMMIAGFGLVGSALRGAVRAKVSFA